MKFFKKNLIVLCILSSTFIFGQINISEEIQPSAIAKQDSYGLYFIDFWATWCGPCIHVSKYLESLQEQFPNDFYIVSLTKESPDVVSRFMLKYNTKLAVAIDNEGETFKKNKVSSLPWGILYNASGDVLWKGHPADLKGHQVGNFINRNKQRIAVADMLKVKTYEAVTVFEEIDQEDDFEIITLNTTAENKTFRAENHKSYFKVKGDLKSILAYALNSHKSQIDIPEELNQCFDMRFKFDSKSYSNKTKAILKALRLKNTEGEITGEVLVFDIQTPLFWGLDEINWGPDTPRFLIGDSEIKADNVSLTEIKTKLIDVLDLPIIMNHKNLDVNVLHDWDIHYKYFDLMVSVMRDNFGIDVSKKTQQHPKYVISKRGFF